MIAFVFPGQMSEHPDMWNLLNAWVPNSDKYLEIALAAAGVSRVTGAEDESAFGSAEEDLSAQAAVLAANAAYGDHLRRAGVEPDALSGHSLGFYSALSAGGVFRFEEGVRLAARVQRIARSLLGGFDGGMGVVIGHSPERVEEACAGPGKGRVEVANVNTSRQVVVSGAAGSVDAVLGTLAPTAIKVQRLKTRLPFHSRWMRPVSERLLAEVAPGRFSTPDRPIFSHIDGSLVGSAEEARELLCTQICRTVQWLDAIRRMRAAGFQTFIETGPGDILSRMIRWIDRDVEIQTAEKDFGLLAARPDVPAG